MSLDGRDEKRHRQMTIVAGITIPSSKTQRAREIRTASSHQIMERLEERLRIMAVFPPDWASKMLIEHHCPLMDSKFRRILPGIHWRLLGLIP